MENIGYKKKPCEKKKKISPKLPLKNVVITYKSQILKFKIQQKVFDNKMQIDTFE